MPEPTSRLRLKPDAPHNGYVDGAWWPHSDDLGAEIPGLLALLSARFGSVDRVKYKVSDWAKAPEKLASEGHSVRLDGYRLQPPNTLEVSGPNNRVVLAVVPPHTDPERAHAMMIAAAAADNDSTVDELLMISLRERQSRNQRVAARERWEAEGGLTDP